MRCIGRAAAFNFYLTTFGGDNSGIPLVASGTRVCMSILCVCLYYQLIRKLVVIVDAGRVSHISPPFPFFLSPFYLYTLFRFLPSN